MRLSNAAAHQYRDSLGSADASDVLGALAAIQLVPENSNHLARLEAAVQLVTQLPSDAPRRQLTQSLLRDWLNDSPFGHYDDPLNTTFTEELLFFGGSYVVFPGPVEQALFVLRHLSRAIFLAGAWSAARGEQRRAANLIGAVLRLSHALATRSGLSRGIPAASRAGVTVPGTQSLQRLAAATQFDDRALEELLASVGGRETLDPLVRQIEAVPDVEEFGTDMFVARPLVLAESGEIITALPHPAPGAQPCSCFSVRRSGLRGRTC